MCHVLLKGPVLIQLIYAQYDAYSYAFIIRLSQDEIKQNWGRVAFRCRTTGPDAPANMGPPVTFNVVLLLFISGAVSATPTSHRQQAK